ncbi:MAG: hypothetical protein U0694_00990 [Anaerolineae bacterium]
MMMSGYEITCANKNPNGMLVRIGGDNWSMGIRDAVTKLISHQIRFYIRLDGSPLEIGIRGDGADAYLIVEPEGLPLHQVSQLQSC